MLAARGQSLEQIQAWPGPRRGRPLGPRRRAAGAHPGGRAAPPPAAEGGRRDRPSREGEGGRLPAQGGDEGRGRAHQDGRRPAPGGGGSHPAVPPRRAQRARRRRPRGPGRLGQRRGPAGGGAARASTSSRRRTGTWAPSSGSSISSGRPRSRGLASPSTGTSGRDSSGRSSSSCSTSTVSRGYREVIPPYLVTAETLTGTGQLPKFEGDLFKTAAGERDLYLIPTAEVPAHLPPPGRDPRTRRPSRASTWPSRPASARRPARTARTSAGSSVSTSSTRWSSSSSRPRRPPPDELEAMVADAEEVLKRLELAYRVVVLSTGDMGFSAARPTTRGLAAWAAGLPRDLVLLELHRLPGPSGEPALSAGAEGEAALRAHAQRQRPRGGAHPHRRPRELPAGGRLGRHPRGAAPLHGRRRAHQTIVQ